MTPTQPTRRVAGRRIRLAAAGPTGGVPPVGSCVSGVRDRVAGGRCQRITNMVELNPAETTGSARPDVSKRLLAALDAAGVCYEHSQHFPVYTSAEAAAVRGTTLHSGAKALILKGDHGFVMAVIPADLALDGTALRKELGSRRLRFATKEELLALTGLTPGSVPPFGSLFGLKTYCDRGLSDNDQINFNAGSHSNSLRMTYAAYIEFEKPVLADFAKPTDERR